MRYFIESRDTYQCNYTEQWMEIRFNVPCILRHIIAHPDAEIMSAQLCNMSLLPGPPGQSWVGAASLREHEFNEPVRAGYILKVHARGEWSGKLVCEVEEPSHETGTLPPLW